MKSLIKSLLILLLASGAMVFASGGLEQGGGGGPPNGLAISSDAPGTKLSGVVSIELYNFNSSGTSANARIVLRLRRNNDFATLYGEPTGTVDPTSPSASQAVITDTMVPKVIDRFFGNNNGIFTDDGTHDVRVKSLDEFGRVQAHNALIGDSIIILADIVIAVN